MNFNNTKPIVLILAVVFSVFRVDAGNEKDRPNVLMITAHDLGQHIGCYGVETIHTPNIDKLAEKGIRFTHFYSTSSVCSPGRGSLHTGRYPQSNGVMSLTHGPWWWRLKDDEKHTAQLLKKEGYRTILAGLNHIGNPQRLGYDVHISTQKKAEQTVFEVVEFLNKESGKEAPFFLKAGFVEVHRGFDYGSDSTKGIFVPGFLADTPTMRNDLAQFQAEIKYYDSCVGRILDALRKSKIADNTLVILTADHSIPYPGSKWTARKAGLNVPFIMYKKGDKVLAGGKAFNEVMSNVDVLPAVFDYLGIDKPDNFEGVSYWDFLTQKTAYAPRKEAFEQYTPDMKRDNESRTIITDKYQLIHYFSEGRSVRYPTDANPKMFARHQERCATLGSRPFVQLYNIQNDAFELNNLSKDEEYQKVIEELEGKLLGWMKQVKDPLLEGPTASPYYRKSINKLLKEQ